MLFRCFRYLNVRYSLYSGVNYFVLLLWSYLTNSLTYDFNDIQIWISNHSEFQAPTNPETADLRVWFLNDLDKMGSAFCPKPFENRHVWFPLPFHSCPVIDYLISEIMETTLVNSRFLFKRLYTRLVSGHFFAKNNLKQHSFPGK